jgi:hypothetical protein
MTTPTREALARFYERHNPANVQNIDTILKQYEGRAGDLRDGLRKKYGEEIEQPMQGEWSMHWSLEKRKQYWYNSSTEETFWCDNSLPKDWVCGEREVSLPLNRLLLFQRTILQHLHFPCVPTCRKMLSTSM